ncbi:MAG: DUF423 domain-containing protein [Bacteroidota bacterium]
MNQRYTLLSGALLGGLSVAIGAFGAHALEAALTATGKTDTFELAVRYQFFHALALLVIGILMREGGSSLLHWAATFMVAGTLCFSGSLYIIALSELRGGLVFITPLGGTLLITGWALLTTGILRSKTGEG